MDTIPNSSLDRQHLQAVKVPIASLLLISLCLGGWSLIVEPRLQAIAPLEWWPASALMLHWLSPWISGGGVITAIALLFGGLDGVWYQYFTHRRTVIGLLILALIAVVIAFAGPLYFALQLAPLASHGS